MYLLPKIHKRLVNVPGRPVISNCGTPTEKASEFLDHHLQPIMKSGMSYIKDTNDFLSKLKNLKKVPDNAVLFTADVGLYPSIPHNEGLEVLKKQLDNFYEKSIPTEDLVKMAEFVLKNNYFEFNSNVKHQPSGTAIGTICHPSHTRSSIIFSQTQRMRMIGSKKSDLAANVRKLKDCFRERGYPEDMFIKERKRALESPSLGRSKTSEGSASGNGGTEVPLVVNCNPILCRLGQVIRKNLCFLYQDEEVKQVFNPAPFVLFRSVRTLRSHLV